MKIFLMKSWFPLVLGEESLIGKQLKEANTLKMWLWDYGRVFHCSIDLEIAASMGIEMSKDEVCRMLLELITSPKATKTVLAWSDSSLNFKSVMKGGFTSLSWTFVMERLSSKETKCVVKEFMASREWQSSPLEPLQIVDAPNDREESKLEAKPEVKEQTKSIETAPIEQVQPTVQSSQNFSSDSALAILLELKDEVALSNIAMNNSTTSKPETPYKTETIVVPSRPATPSAKEAQKRKELEELTAAKTKKLRRFI